MTSRTNTGAGLRQPPVRLLTIVAFTHRDTAASLGESFSSAVLENPKTRNERIKFLLKNGETGFIMEHDRNTADHCYNVDHPEVVARREDVGLTGAVMQSVRDTAICMDGLPVDSSFGHAGGAVVQHAPFALAAYWTVAKQRGFDLAKLPGTGQSDFQPDVLGMCDQRADPYSAGPPISMPTSSNSAIATCRIGCQSQ